MEKEERILRVACSVYPYLGERGNFHGRYNDFHPGSSTIQCLVNIFFPCLFFFFFKLRVRVHKGWGDQELLNSGGNDAVPRRTDHFIPILPLL